MKNPAEVFVSCEKPAEVVSALHAVMPLIPRELWHHYSHIKMELFSKYGFEGTFERVNGKSVEAIIREFGNIPGQKLIRSGEIDGTSFTVYGPSDERTS